MSGQLKEIRLRIVSVQSTQQITIAMKMVSATKFRRAQDNITNFKPYAQSIKEVVTEVVSSVDKSVLGELKLTEQRPINKVLYVVITSDRGLCGAYNTSIIKLALESMNKNFTSQFEKNQISVLPIGKKAHDFFVKQKIDLIPQFKDLLQTNDVDSIQACVHYIIQSFLEKKYDSIKLVFSEFKNASTQNFVVEDCLPIKVVPPQEGQKKISQDYIFEPSKEKLLEELLPKVLNTQLHKAILEATASEHGARMVAMEKASENAKELIKELKLSYNKARQDAITTELNEIVGGSAVN